MVPQYWKSFIEQHSLVGKEISIPDNIDLSQVGAVFEILDEKSIQVETEDLFPGIIVSKNGFCPVAGCLIGTGDQYFINNKDGVGGPLYRIYHDLVNENGYDRKKAVDVVIRDYTNILNYLEDT
jgi:hypothetical protein